MFKEVVALENKIEKYNEDFMAAAYDIHPKLVSRLSIPDLYDEALCDDTLMDKHTNIIRPMYSSAVVDIRNDVLEISKDYLHTVRRLYTSFDDAGGVGVMRKTSQHISTYDIDNLTWDSLWNDTVLRTEHYIFVHKLRCLVQELNSVQPFWTKNIYTIKRFNETVRMTPFSTPKEYIEENKKSLVMGSFYADAASVRLIKVVRYLDSKPELKVPNISSNIQGNGIVRDLTDHVVADIVLNALVDSGMDYGEYKVHLGDEFEVKAITHKGKISQYRSNNNG